MRVMICGGDGYLGWPTAMDMALSGNEVLIVDNYLRRKMAIDTNSLPLFQTPDMEGRAAIFASEYDNKLQWEVFDCCDHQKLFGSVERFQPDLIIHYAEQPSAPYSMQGFDEAKMTMDNNLQSTFNIIWAVKQFVPSCHIIKLGTMGEYGTPNIDIEEGWLEVEHNGRKQEFLYPRQASSLYHTTKVLDTDLLWFYVRTYNIRVTDLMQGPVYGLSPFVEEANSALRPNFHYDDIFGTVVNRFLVQAVAREPLTVYGAGGQTRGYLNLKDTLQCVKLAANNPPEPGELRILNQFTETFSVNDLASRIKSVGDAMGLSVTLNHIKNPRKELEDHYYNPKHSGLLELGLEPHFMTDNVIAEMLDMVIEFENQIDTDLIMPRVSWS